MYLICILSFQATAASPKPNGFENGHNCDKQKENAKPKKKASDKIIEILTAKKIQDEKSSVNSPVSSKRRLSEYVSEKLHLSGKSRSNTPVSPQISRKNLN